MSEARVLHVLPHRGGGGEAYVEQLASMAGFDFDRVELTRRRNPLELAGGLARVIKAARGDDLVHVHGDAAALACLPAIGMRPTVITLHGSHLLRRASGTRGRLVREGSRRAFARAAAVIAVSESELSFTRGIAPAAAGRITLIHNGVPDAPPVSDADRRVARETLGVEPDSYVAVFVGELSERKQPVQFAEAVARARIEQPRIVGMVVGEGPLRGRLEPMAVDGLKLLGERHDVTNFLAAADAFVLPSLWEGLSYALLEAMSLGLATVVSDGPGNPDAVGDAGLVFPVGDVDALASSLVRLASDPELGRSLGEAAAARARERFSLSGMIEATAEVYERALSGRAT
jgi:glycosyltransferase involved in cell wall biosynthesis